MFDDLGQGAQARLARSVRRTLVDVKALLDSAGRCQAFDEEGATEGFNEAR